MRENALILIAAIMPAACPAAETLDNDDWSAHVQATYIWQDKPAFPSAYSGPNSLSSFPEQSHTASGTLYLGVRPWQDGEIYLNIEAAQGVPFSSSLTGLAGFTNGELSRASGPQATLYRQRLFLRQTWNLGNGMEKSPVSLNQMAGTIANSRFVLTAGNFSVLDIFDNNAYAMDPRTQFVNWGAIASAAFDYPGDARGFGWGVAGEWYQEDWVLRFGRLTGPKEPNGASLDFRLLEHYGDEVELEHGHAL